MYSLLLRKVKIRNPAFRLISGFLFAFVLLVSVAACAPPASSPQPLPADSAGLTADQVRNSVLKSIQNVTSYRFNLVMDNNVSAEGGKKINQKSTIAGSLDKKLRKMKISLSLVQQIQNSNSTATRASSEIYVLDNEMYVRSSGLGTSAEWQKQTAVEGIWDNQDMITQQTLMLKNAGVKLLGQAKIQNIDCYVLELTPDWEMLWSSLSDQLGFQDYTADIEPQDLINNVSMQIWVSRDDYLPRQIKEVLSLNANALSGEKPVPGSNAASIEISIILTASDYNQDIPIELPSEIKKS